MASDKRRVTSDEISEAEAAEMVADIEALVKWENAGFATDWTAYPFTTKRLVAEWRDAEAEVKRIHTYRMQAYLKSKFEQH